MSAAETGGHREAVSDSDDGATMHTDEVHGPTVGNKAERADISPSVTLVSPDAARTMEDLR